MDYRVFPCPSCHEIVDTTMQSCKFCGAAIDPAASALAATAHESVQKACAEASSTRITAFSMPVFFLLAFVPFIGILGLAGTVATLILVPIQLIRWRIRFGKIESPDPDLGRARRGLRDAALVWAAMLVVNLLWFLFRASLLGQLRY